MYGVDDSSYRAHASPPPVHLILVGLLCFGNAVSSNAQSDSSRSHKAIVTGQISATGELYNNSDSAQRYVPFSWTVYGDVAIKTGNWTIPCALVISEKERDFRQAFNQAGISAENKWLKLHAGYRNLYFSGFTLAGVTMLGGGIELNPGKFRFGAAYGRLQRKVAMDSTNKYDVFPAFERWGYALRIGVGTTRSFFDLIYFGAKDQAGSLSGYERGGLTPA